MSAVEELAQGSPRPAGAEVVWVALGDSFTAGIASYERTWASIVEERLARSAPARLLNLARMGARCADVVSEQLPAALSSEPTVITAICGANDVVRSVRPDLEAVGEGLARTFGRIRGAWPRVPVLTATYPAIASDALRPRTSARIADGIAELNEVIRCQAEAHGIALAELAHHPGQADSRNYAEDGIHPSQTGHRLAAEVLGPALEALVNREPRKETTQ